MAWVFAAVVLVLAVLHPGFRKVLYWLAGAIATLGFIAFLTHA